jgi:phenylpropionate dioxygenase-like ring-hydroxylating dioxygenase large terminal subunit
MTDGITSGDRPVREWVDHARGLVSREIFVDRDVYQMELERLFTRTWLFVGHESLVPNNGDFFTSRMGEESVILCRDRQGAVHVFLNSCRHRGMKVCRYDQGNTSLFTCPYHAWSYSTDGKLQGVPLHKQLYDGVLDRDAMSLIEVPKLAIYKGTVWASWDPDAPDFLTYLGDAKLHLDQALDCRDGRPGGSEVIGVHKWIFPANWKFAAENFLGDTYHNPSHRSVDLIGIGPSAQAGVKGRRDDELQKAQHIWISFPQGHGMHSAIAPARNEYMASFLNNPRIEEYFRHCFEERKRRLGNEAARLLPFTGTIFPNASMHGRQPRGICVWHPHAPTETEAWRFFLVDADAPAEVKEFLRHYYMRYSGPAGMTEQDDMENWLYATRASVGTIARRYPFNYQQSMHASTVNGPMPGNLSLQITEQMARGYYQSWDRYMKGEGWDRLLGVDLPSYPKRAAAE